MSASYPAASKSFAAIVDGVDYPQATQVNQAYDEITAVETALVSSGLAHNLTPDSSANARTLGSTSKAWGLSYLKGLNFSAATTLTLVSHVTTIVQGYHAIDSEAAAATDTCTSLTAGTGVQEGFVVILRAANVAHVVTLVDGGNLLLNGNCALSATDRSITLIYDGTNWREVARSGPATSEGTWTPADGSGAALSLTGVVGNYTKVDKLVTAWFALTYPATADGANSLISGLPFAATADTTGSVTIGSTNYSASVATGTVTSGGTTFAWKSTAGAALTNANLTGRSFTGCVVYRAAA